MHIIRKWYKLRGRTSRKPIKQHMNAIIKVPIAQNAKIEVLLAHNTIKMDVQIAQDGYTSSNTKVAILDEESAIFTSHHAFARILLYKKIFPIPSEPSTKKTFCYIV
jgi:hypothetical protein